jgi:hypothetical protein
MGRQRGRISDAGFGREQGSIGILPVGCGTGRGDSLDADATFWNATNGMAKSCLTVERGQDLVASTFTKPAYRQTR